MWSEFYYVGMAPALNSLLEKWVSFCSSLKALSTDTSFIKIGFCYQKLSTLEFNFHYQLSSHCEFIMQNHFMTHAQTQELLVNISYT